MHTPDERGREPNGGSQDVLTGTETVIEYEANELIVIPARTAHLFEYLEDSYMVEWWACDFKAWCACFPQTRSCGLNVAVWSI